MKDIATLAGTSVATVSRVINHSGRFSKETEQKVLNIIEEYGYEQNQLAKGLRAKHTHIVGIIVPDIENEFYARITKLVQQELLGKNYMALICNTNENDEDVQKYMQILRGFRVDGIIYIGNVELSQAIDIPTVYIDRDPRDQNFIADTEYAMVECDNIDGGYLAGKELVSKGCRHPCFVAYDINITTHKKRLSGFKKAIAEEGLELDDRYIFSVPMLSFSCGKAIMKEIRIHFPEVDGIFFASDMLAIGALNDLNESGVKIPEEMHIIGFDDISSSANYYPALTTVRQPIKEMSALAVERIMDKIHGKKIEPQRVRLPVELISRSTT